LDQRLEQYFTASSAIKHLKEEENLDKEVKTEAVRLASLRDDRAVAWDLNELSWSMASTPGREPSSYQYALRQAKAACEITHEAMQLNTLGVAYYRVGEFKNALAALMEADRLNQGSYNRAIDLFFMAMCRQRLGEYQRARELLSQAKDTMANDDSPQLALFEDEAQQLVDPSIK
jgi:tetratricopeptide (TPR) repeat protein